MKTDDTWQLWVKTINKSGDITSWTMCGFFTMYSLAKEEAGKLDWRVERKIIRCLEYYGDPD